MGVENRQVKTLTPCMVFDALQDQWAAVALDTGAHLMERHPQGPNNALIE